MTHPQHQEFARPGVDTQFKVETADFTSSLQPQDFENLNRTMLQSNGKADEALKEKGILPELKLVAEHSNKSLTPDQILKYGKTAAIELNQTAVELLNKATGVFSPEADTANKIGKLAKDVNDGTGWFSDNKGSKNPHDRTSGAAERKAIA